jgi:hypothetical protein
MISFKLLKYIVSYCLNTVATTVTLGVSQSVRGSLFQREFETFFSSSLSFCLVCRFMRHLLDLLFFLLLDDHRGSFVSGLTSKSLGQVFRFGPQNRQLWFGDLGLKITTMIS